jgi:hypothetical protein
MSSPLSNELAHGGTTTTGLDMRVLASYLSGTAPWRIALGRRAAGRVVVGLMRAACNHPIALVHQLSHQTQKLGSRAPRRAVCSACPDSLLPRGWSGGVGAQAAEGRAMGVRAREGE